ncbi:type II toxin-antitoxin system RelE family toxin [Candidatus Bandiella euplotis]|nr:type II toxin-antitoxin system RelE/ParE family toxin [Candidatus Bandiella woodruffii]
MKKNMTWRINFTTGADKDFSKLEKQEQKRIIGYLRQKVQQDPRAHGIALKSNDLVKIWRYRVGKYRILSQIKDNDLVVLVIRIGKRDSVYKIT